MGLNITKILQIRDSIRCGADIAVDAASSYGIEFGEQKLVEINECAHEKFLVTAALNAVMLVCASFAFFFIRDPRYISLLIASFANYALLGRVVFNIIRFIHSILLPYHTLILYLLPCALAAFKKNRTFKNTIRDIIRAAVSFYYNKIPITGQVAHEIFSVTGLVKNRTEIEVKAAEDFYPLVCRFLRVVLLENFILFGVSYGAFIFIIKQFLFHFMLNMSYADIFLYPFMFICGNTEL